MFPFETFILKLTALDCHIFPVKRRVPCLFFLSFFLFFLCVLLPPDCHAVDKSEEEILQDLLERREENLWQEANSALLDGRDREAVQFFRHYYKTYPESPRAETALWKASNLNKDLALTSTEADWETVKDLYRSFTVDYPKSVHLSDAYFEVGNSFFRMGFYREARTYFSLFLKRFPASSRSDEARYMKARSLMRIRKTKEAGNVYKELEQSRDKVYSLRGRVGAAHIYFFNKEYHDALAVYLKILREVPSFYRDDPDLLRNKGIAGLRVGNVDEGRKDLFQYLNMTGNSPLRQEVLFELAESYMQGGQEKTAAKLYEQIIDEGMDEERLVVLSRFRLARQEAEGDGGDRVNVEESGQKDDRPFQMVLEQHYSDPLSQDARFDLVRRYWARGESDEAFNMGKSYLRYETVEAEKDEVVDVMGQVLVQRVEKLLQDKDYKGVYALYQQEYPHVKAYRRGRLLFLVGRALEEMSLYKKAGVVYYRAMARELDKAELRDLYLQRARTYLSDRDLKAAQRLLKYLRKIYAGENVLGEVCWLSGRLREMQERPDDALNFYRIAVGNPTFADKKNRYADDYLRLLFEQDEILEKAAVLDVFQKEKWLTGERLQHWYGKLGERYQVENDAAKAETAYRQALSVSMAKDKKQRQRLYLQFGDVLLSAGKNEEAASLFQQALDGPDPLVKKMAQQRLDREKINKAMIETEAVLNN